MALALSAMITVNASPTRDAFGSANSDVGCPQADPPLSSIASSDRVPSRFVITLLTVPTTFPRSLYLLLMRIVLASTTRP